MYAFCGLMRFDQNSVAADTISNMLQSLVRWHPDYQDIWHQKGVGLGQVFQLNLPESKYESLPGTNRCNNLLIVSDSRIDNRNELCDVFQVESGFRSSTPDSSLILLAYEKMG